jgi:hypothetical protein
MSAAAVRSLTLLLVIQYKSLSFSLVQQLTEACSVLYPGPTCPLR